MFSLFKKFHFYETDIDVLELEWNDDGVESSFKFLSDSRICFCVNSS